MKEQMIAYLQSLLDVYRMEEAKYGADDRIVQKKLTGLLSCQAMAETLIGEPVNLGLDGRVTIGF